MNYKTVAKMNESFVLDEKYELFLGANNEPVRDSLLKGYIYANLYFFDEVEKELNKLRKMIEKIREEIAMEVDIGDDPSKLLLELSVRVRNAIGDDSLDAFIKEILAETHKHIALMPDERENEKFLKVKESILLELFANFFKITFSSIKAGGDTPSFQLPQKYVDDMTERQKKLLAPAIRMVGFANRIRLDKLEIRPDFTVRIVPEQLSEDFDKQEESIKHNIKRSLVFVQHRKQRRRNNPRFRRNHIRRTQNRP